MINAHLNLYLDININLRAREELGHHSSFKRLLQVEAHLGGFAVSMRSPLPLRRAECGHAVLAVDSRSIVEGPTSRATHLEVTEIVTSDQMHKYRRCSLIRTVN